MRRSIIGSSLALAACMAAACAGFGQLNARAAGPPPSPSPAVVGQGQAMLHNYNCIGCHGQYLQGTSQNGKLWAPSLHQQGPMGHISSAQFVKLMHTGIKPNGKHVKPVMPTFTKMPTADAKVLYEFLQVFR